MPLEMSFTKESGAEFPESYWKLTNLTVIKQSKTASIEFSGWVNKESFDSGKPPEKDLGVSYGVSIEGKFSQYFSASVLNQANHNIYKQAYLYAKNEDSFFENAEDVDL